MTRKLTVMLGKLIDRGREEMNKEKKECHNWQGTDPLHSYTGQLGNQSAIFLKMEYVVAIQDSTDLTQRVLQQSLITDLKVK